MQNYTGLYLFLGLIVAGIPSGFVAAYLELREVKEMNVDKWLECNEAQKKGLVVYAISSVFVLAACAIYWALVGRKGPIAPWSMGAGTALLVGGPVGLIVMAFVAWRATRWLAKRHGFKC